MVSKRKPTLKQLFKEWIRYEKKKSELTKLKWELDALGNEAASGTELIIHEDDVYRITKTNHSRYGINYSVERIASAEELPEK
jgi:hypothetical protein